MPIGINKKKSGGGAALGQDTYKPKGGPAGPPKVPQTMPLRPKPSPPRGGGKFKKKSSPSHYGGD